MRSPVSRFLVCTTALLLLTGCSRSTTHDESFDDSQPSVAGPSSDALAINKMGGDIDVADAPNGADLRTMGGSITVGKVEKALSAKTMGGNVDVQSADVSSLVVKTMGGNIDIGPAKALDLKATTMGGNITAQTLSDGSVILKSMGGNIDLTIPKNSSAQIDIELEYSGLNDRGYTITDNLGLQQQKTTEWNLWHLTHNYRVSAQGVTGSGTNHIVIKAAGGNVTLNSQ
jgi:hypothetical protein